MNRTAMPMPVRVALACGLCSAAMGAQAKGPDHRALVERIVRCEASLQEVADFNGLVDQNRLRLPEAADVRVIGGVAWKVEPPISVGGTESGVALMNSRFSFYIQVPSADPRAGVYKAAEELDLFKQFDEGAYLSYRREFGPVAPGAMTGDDGRSYWVGCDYDQNEVRRLLRNARAASPEGARIKEAARQALGQ